MSPSFAKKANVSLQDKEDSYPVVAVDGKPLGYNHGRVDQETKDTRIRIGPYAAAMQFDITVTGTHDIVLGLPWLKEANPQINWARQMMHFPQGWKVPLSEDLPDDGIEICAISSNQFRDEIRKHPGQAQILWT